MSTITQWLYQLTPCPLCKKQPSSDLACCSSCSKHLFQPLSSGNNLTLGVYEGKLEKAIRSLKYHHVTRFARLFAQELAKEISEQNWQLDTVTAVPLHWRRYLERGYNQAALIARPLAKELKLAYQKLLTRTLYTKQQAKLAGLERQENVRNAFASRTLEGQHILLIDDVYTTGATLKACTTMLIKAGAGSVKTACVAKAIRRSKA